MIYYEISAYDLIAVENSFIQCFRLKPSIVGTSSSGRGPGTHGAFKSLHHQECGQRIVPFTAGNPPRTQVHFGRRVVRAAADSFQNRESSLLCRCASSQPAPLDQQPSVLNRF
jgi:hypothetical protein